MTAEEEARVRTALAQVIDPELGCDIVSLGLIYGVDATPAGVVRVTMTTTTPGCPATAYLTQGAQHAASGELGIPVEVLLTHDPEWTPAMMSPEAKRRFGIAEQPA